MNMKQQSDNIYIVYKHTTPNNKVYIGITKHDPKYRWLNNGRGYKVQSTFFNAILKYGWINIKHEILYTNLTEEQALDKEEELIQQYKSYDRRYGYNISLRGPKYGEFIKEHKIKSRRLPVSNVPNWKNRGKIINKLDKSNNIIKTYRCVRELALELNTPIETLRSRLNKYKTLDFGDYKFQYSKLEQPIVQMLSLSGELIKEFPSLVEAYKYINRVNKGGITEVCVGKKCSYVGYKWRFKYEDKDN